MRIRNIFYYFFLSAHYSFAYGSVLTRSSSRRCCRRRRHRHHRGRRVSRTGLSDSEPYTKIRKEVEFVGRYHVGTTTRTTVESDQKTGNTIGLRVVILWKIYYLLKES